MLTSLLTCSGVRFALQITVVTLVLCSSSASTRGSCLRRSPEVTHGFVYRDPRVTLTFHPNSKTILDWIVNNKRNAEDAVHKLLMNILLEDCTPTSLFLDIGANAGFYGILGAAYGCKAILFDPQPSCQLLIRENICLNSWLRHSVRLVPSPVSDKIASFHIPHGTCDGHFALTRNTPKSALPDTVAVTTVQVAAITGLTRPVLLAKVDVEGHELEVLRSLRPLISRGLIQHLVVEVSPTFWDSKERYVNRTEMYLEFVSILNSGCEIRRVLDLGASDRDLNSIDRLHEYVVLSRFDQEDLYIRCT